ncbi:phage integrase family protein [Burkholderia seminalis]|uniref:phage integrase family protein n=1 Tax=Burkholderia seminalis TaxID=488731 RepID=UPI0021F41C2D|nr:phage integrase family protein [Burkholderia seminalis]
MALRLADVGLTTIGKLVETINAVGCSWHRRVPCLGDVGVRRIVAWLAHYGNVAGLQLAAGAQTHASEGILPGPQLAVGRPVTAIVPRVLFSLPPEQNG